MEADLLVSAKEYLLNFKIVFIQKESFLLTMMNEESKTDSSTYFPKNDWR